MKNNLRKSLAILLCAVFVLCAVPAVCFAASDGVNAPDPHDEQILSDSSSLTLVSPNPNAGTISSGEVDKLRPKNGITTIKELDGKKIGVQTGVLYEDLIKDTIQGEEWMYFKMPNDMIPALTSKKISAYLIEEVGYYAQKYERPELVRLDEAAGYCDFAVIIGADENQAKYYAQLQEFIAAKKADGWLDELYDYWVKNWNPNTCVIRSIPETTGENGSVTIAIEGGYEPFSFESNGKFSGYDVEFMMNFCAAYGYQWDFRAMEFDAIATSCLAGKYNFGMNIVVDEERADASVLSDPYYRCDVVFVLEGQYESEMTFFEKMAYSFQKTFIKEERWRDFVDGIRVTAVMTVSSILLGTVLGFALYMLCRHGNKVANGFMKVFNGFIHGIPTVLFLMILSYIVFEKMDNAEFISIFGFSLIFGCAMYDNLCVGCNAISKGQTEASRALGYSDNQCFFKIILPQAARHFLPIYRNDVVSLIKETSIVGYIAVMDLTKRCDLVRSRTYEPFFALIATAIFYFVMEFVLTTIIKKIEHSLDPTHRSEEKVLKGIETWE